jgi:tRNA(adenine34) deaminase
LPDEESSFQDERWMEEALTLARRAESEGETPIGAVVVAEGRVVGRGWNAPLQNCDPTAHAEMAAIREASKTLGNYRLSEADLYATLEPCPMCAGAIVHARIRRLVFGCRDLRFGGVRSKFRIADSELLNHQTQVVEGVMGHECVALLRRFFQSRR